MTISIGNRATLAALAALMLASSWTGADYAHYADWANAAITHSLWNADTFTISPLGVPVLMWSHGTGFVFATGHLVLGPLGDLRLSAMLVGWLAALVFWAATLRVTWTLSGRSLSLTVFCAGATALGTHAGYLSNTHASESLALACAAVLLWLVVEDDMPRTIHGLIAGLAIGFLVTIKSYWAVYAAAAVVVLAWRTRRSRVSWTRLAGIVMAFTIPIAVGLTQTAMTNRWMTGSPLQSSYVFGDEQFSSFDFREPELAAVLTHPLHGLLSHHPLYGLAFVALLAVIATPGDAGRRIFFAIGGLAIIANLYFQSAWVVWWLGNATFGMRGMALATTVVIPALVISLRRARETRPWLFAVACVSAVACCFWSFLLLLEGSTRFHTFAEMADAQWYAFSTFWGPTALLAATATAALAVANRNLFRRPAGAAIVLAAGAVLVGLWVVYLWLRVAERPFDQTRSLLLGGVGVSAALLLAAAIAWGLSRALGRDRSPKHVVRNLAAAIAAVVFAGASISFFGLAREVAEQGPDPGTDRRREETSPG